MCWGTPEGVLNVATHKSKTYYASLVHDALYQFSGQMKSFITRKEVDREFYLILSENKFKSARMYYHAVRLFGWRHWGKNLN